MNRMRKVFAMALALMLMLALAVPALADNTEGGGGTPAAQSGEVRAITIQSSDNKGSHKFVAYQVFAGTLSSTGDILSDVDWENGIDLTKAVNGKTLIQAIQAIAVGEIGAETPFQACESAADVAQVLNDEGARVAISFAEVVSQYVTGSGTALPFIEATAETDGRASYTADNFTPGYYVIIDNALPGELDGGRPSDPLLVLAGNVDDVVVTAKVGVATVEKYAGDKSSADNTSWGVGDTVPYTLEGTLSADYNSTAPDYEYTFTDVFDDALELVYTHEGDTVTQDGEDASVTITTRRVISGVNVTVQNGAGDNVTTENITNKFEITYSYKTHTTTDGTTYNTDKKLIVSNKDLSKIEAINSTSKILVTYEAKIVSEPTQPDLSIYNMVKLTYGTDTAMDTERIFPLNLVIQKVDGGTLGGNGAIIPTPAEGAETTPTTFLHGAVFQLSRTKTTDGTTATEYLTKTGDTIGWVTDAADPATELTTDEQGRIELSGIPTGTYTLTEITAPDGYNKLESPITLIIEGTVTFTAENAKFELKGLNLTVDGNQGEVDAVTNTVTATIANNKGAALPSTGGAGTTVFYVVGGVLAAGAAVLLITKKRVGAGRD